MSSFRERIWDELAQAKFHENYSCELISYQRNVLNFYNITIAVFSTGGIMGWKFWETMPLISCSIISIIALLKFISPHIIPSEKQIEKVNNIIDFYTAFYSKIEELWYKSQGGRISNADLEKIFFEIKNTEKEINKTVNEIIKRPNKSLIKKAEEKSASYFKRVFKV
jgi:hypothetical protein